MSSGRIHDDEPAQKPSGWKNCMNFLYNSETGQIIGRTSKSWGLIGLFYLIYYAALAGFFAVCLGVFLHTLDNDAPRQQHMYSPLKSTPGMGFRPKLSTSESSLIKFTANDSKTYNEYIQNLEHTLEEFRKQKGENVIDCNTTDGFDQPSSGDVCSYPLRLLGEECTSEKQFGFSTGKPCILLKINRVYDWQPVPFSEERLNDTTDAFAQEAKQLLGDRLLNNYVGISCEGENDADKDNIRSSAFYPNNGLPYAFFPYRNQPNYVSPVAMVQFDVVPGRLVMIWCKLWASDLKHNRNDLQGSVHFELLVDNKQAQQF